MPRDSHHTNAEPGLSAPLRLHTEGTKTSDGLTVISGELVARGGLISVADWTDERSESARRASEASQSTTDTRIFSEQIS